MARERTTKALAKRIQLEYWNKPHPWRTWMARATMLAPMLATIWLIAVCQTEGEHVFNGGPVSTRHAMFGKDCMQCHEPWAGAPDQKCLSCHEAPLHHANQTMIPECASCHVEHKGHQVLARIEDQHCTRCHSDLKTLTGPPGFAAKIKNFSDGHPEFRLIKDGVKDKTALGFNHKLHLKANLQGPDGCVTLECTSCHTPDNAGRYMPPPTFAQHCKSCHPLQLGMTLPGEVAPHSSPELVSQAVHASLTKLSIAHPEKMKAEAPPSGHGGRRRSGSSASTAPTTVVTSAWIAKQATEIEGKLFGKACKLCHQMTSKQASLPEVVPTTIPSRWMPHSAFGHRAHRALTCVVCHGAARNSTETSDVMIPSITTCATCHSPEGGARSSCNECHMYHDKSKEWAFDGPMEINPVLVRKKSLARP